MLHVLLIGIDDYPHAPLGGCVNDIDAVQQLLLGPRMSRPHNRIRIRRLASPVSGRQPAAAAGGTAIPEQPATLDHLRGALAELASDAVAPGDRVFIYYSGHGERVECKAQGGRRFHREALLPADCAEAGGRRLFDFEINERLRAIAARTVSVTVVLDCCHAAGASRSDKRDRHLDLASVLDHRGPLPDPAAGNGAGAPSAPGDAWVGGNIGACHVVTACQSHERALENRWHGVQHGVLTGAFVAALEAAELDLDRVTWSQIWQVMRANVECRNGEQHPWSSGNPARAVFGGPPVDDDPGIALTRVGDAYRLEAGTLAGITPGAKVAVYSGETRRFPRLDSAQDLRARLAELRVAAADRVTATTVKTRQLDLPPDARARLIRAGEDARLQVGVIPPNPTIETQLAQSPMLELVRPGDDAPVRLELIDGVWRVTDDKHASRRDAPVLVALPAGKLGVARAVLEHYRSYAAPLRMAKLAGDLPGMLVLRALVGPDRPITTREAQEARFPRAPTPQHRDSYRLVSGERLCFSVHNRWQKPLHVTLLNSAGSGRVQLLGDHVIDSDKTYVFWFEDNLGSPFTMAPPAGSPRCLDRIVAIGRSSMTHDLKRMASGLTFAEVIKQARPAGAQRDAGGEVLEHWTSAQIVIDTRTA